MITIDNVRIRVADDRNLTYAVYVKVVNKKTKEERYDWVESNRWFGKLEHCLLDIKNKIAMSLIETKDLTPQEFVKELETILNGYVKIEVNVKDETR